MIEMIASIVNAVASFLENFRFFMGLVIGGLVAAIITALFSYPVFGFFNVGLFSILFVPCVLLALYWQLKSKKH